MGHKKKITLRVIQEYSKKVISKTDDPFINTALQRGCVTTEDFERFFDQLLDIPKYLSKLLGIKQYDLLELDDAIKEGQKNKELMERINNAYKSKWHKEKGKNRLLHDAGLIAGAEFLRKQLHAQDREVKKYFFLKYCPSQLACHHYYCWHHHVL